MMESLTTLHKLAHSESWDDVISRLEEFPEEARVRASAESWNDQLDDHRAPQDCILGTGGMTALHIICTRKEPPFQVIEKYIDVAPEVCVMTTENERTPLHYACYTRQSLVTINALCLANPEVISSIDFIGWNVFHMCVRFGMSDGVMKLLLKKSNETGTLSEMLRARERRGRTPFDLACEVKPRINKRDFFLLFNATPFDESTLPPLQQLCTNYHEYLGGSFGVAKVPRNKILGTEPSHFCNEKKCVTVERLWLWRPKDSLALWAFLRKALSILGGCDANIATRPILHECLRQDAACKTITFECLLSLNPFYACHLDDDGNLPLHVGSELAGATEEWRSRLQRLVHLYPRAASIPNKRGKLPFELLNHDTLAWESVAGVLAAWPTAIQKLELHVSLYARVIFRLAENSSHDAVYTILKDSPTLVQR